MPDDKTTSTPRRLHAIVKGRVQGVNFRAETYWKAESLALTGWVRNRPDGTVEVLAEGPQGKLETLLGFLRVGPPSARVTGVEVTWLEPSGEFASFEVRHFGFS
jgi:acylphosphatase